MAPVDNGEGGRRRCGVAAPTAAVAAGSVVLAPATTQQFTAAGPPFIAAITVYHKGQQK